MNILKKIKLNCEYCGKGIFIRKRKIYGFVHQLGVIPDRILRIHKKCAEGASKFEKEFHSGEVVHCIDCNGDFYLININCEDCPVKGMAQNHRISESR